MTWLRTISLALAPSLLVFTIVLWGSWAVPLWIILAVILAGSGVFLVYRAARRGSALLTDSSRLVHETDGLTEAEQQMRTLTESALAPRPPWQVRILVEGQTLPAIACYRVPPGFARDEKEAVNYIRRRHRHAREGYAHARWLAFPVVGESWSGSGA